MVVNERRGTAGIGRRRLLASGIAAAAALVGTAPGRRAHSQSPVTLTLAVWGAQAEEDAFKAIVDKYQAFHPKVTIRLEVNGNAMQLYQLVDTRLAGRQAPASSGSSTSRSGATPAQAQWSICQPIWSPATPTNSVPQSGRR